MNTLDKETVIAYAEMLMECTEEEMMEQAYELATTSSELAPEDYDLLRVLPVTMMTYKNPSMVVEYSTNEAQKVLDLMENFLRYFQDELFDYIGDNKGTDETLSAVFFLMTQVSAKILLAHGIELMPDA